MHCQALVQGLALAEREGILVALQVAQAGGLGPGGFAAGRLVELVLQLVELVMVFRAMLVLRSVTYNSPMPDLY